MIERKPLKEKACKYSKCRKKFTPINPLQYVCSYNHARLYAEEHQKKKEKNAHKSPKRATREEKQSIMTHGDWENKLQVQINTIVRLIDKGQNCISCNGDTTPQAGHYHSVGANNSLRFNLHNIHIQDTNCNMHKSSNIIEYNAGLKKIYGEAYKNYVEIELRAIYKHIKLSIDEIREKMFLCKQIAKELKLTNSVYNSQERIGLRDKLNSRISIYEKSYQQNE